MIREMIKHGHVALKKRAEKQYQWFLKMKKKIPDGGPDFPREEFDIEYLKLGDAVNYIHDDIGLKKLKKDIVAAIKKANLPYKRKWGYKISDLDKLAMQLYRNR